MNLARGVIESVEGEANARARYKLDVTEAIVAKSRARFGAIPTAVAHDRWVIVRTAIGKSTREISVDDQNGFRLAADNFELRLLIGRVVVIKTIVRKRFSDFMRRRQHAQRVIGV